MSASNVEKTLDLATNQPVPPYSGITQDNMVNYFRHCLVDNFASRLQRDPVLGTYTSDGADGTTIVPKGFETIEDMVAAWKERDSDGGAWIKQAALDCGAFPHKRLMSGQIEGFMEYEEDEGVGGIDEELE